MWTFDILFKKRLAVMDPIPHLGSPMPNFNDPINKAQLQSNGLLSGAFAQHQASQEWQNNLAAQMSQAQIYQAYKQEPTPQAYTDGNCAQWLRKNVPDPSIIEGECEVVPEVKLLEKEDET